MKLHELGIGLGLFNGCVQLGHDLGIIPLGRDAQQGRAPCRSQAPSGGHVGELAHPLVVKDHQLAHFAALHLGTNSVTRAAAYGRQAGGDRLAPF